jgi:hypothetical protein
MNTATPSNHVSNQGQPESNWVDPKWLNSGWGYRAKSVDDLLRAITRIGSLRAGRKYVWRGVVDARWRIRPSIVVDLLKASEKETHTTELEISRREAALVREARSWGIGLELGPASNDLQLLAYLQHHGVPTRLLDVTTNPITALWFACERQVTRANGRASGALFAFDVTDLPVYYTVDPIIKTTVGSTMDPQGWPLRNALRLSAEERRPFLLLPSMPDLRMRAQEGLFIAGSAPVADDNFHGMDGIPFAANAAPGLKEWEKLFDANQRKRGSLTQVPFCAIVISPEIKKLVLPHLQGTYNRSHRALFPDVAGFKDAVIAGHIDLTPSADMEDPNGGAPEPAEPVS